MVFNDDLRPALAAFLLLTLLPVMSHAHGGVVREDDLCVINIGYLKAHFKIYVPQKTGHSEYCEDIPVQGESVFVMEYQHDGLNDAEIDFKIIKNLTGKGTFARIEDVNAIDDIDAITLSNTTPAVVPDVFMLLQRFEEDGEYIGIVSARRTDTDKVYTAVFPFEVGYTGVGIWPAIIAALLLLQLNYWIMSRRRVTKAVGVASVLLLFTVSPGLAVAADGTWASDDGHFRVSYTSHLDPIVINKIHGWILHIASSDEEPVDEATISISGGMPAHLHGMPTQPRVVEFMGNGNYRVEGMRFHMGGDWEIRISIDDGVHRDSVTIPLEL